MPLPYPVRPCWFPNQTFLAGEEPPPQKGPPFIDTAKGEASTLLESGVDNSCDHLPVIRAAKECPDPKRGLLRLADPQDEEDYEHSKLTIRIPYLIVMPKYDPISGLTRDATKVLAAFFALMYCKFGSSCFHEPCSHRFSRPCHALEHRYSTRRHQR